MANSDGLNYVESSMFDLSKPKIGWSSSITERWTCSFDKMVFEPLLVANIEMQKIG